jgi:hypothetical protein
MRLPNSLRQARFSSFRTSFLGVLVVTFLIVLSAGAKAQDGVPGSSQNPGWSSDSTSPGLSALRQGRRPKGMPRFFDPAVHPAIGLEGN